MNWARPAVIYCLVAGCVAWSAHVVLIPGFLGSEAAAEVTVTPSTSPSHDYEKDIQKFEEADRKAPPPTGGVLFIGSSSIRMWKTLATDFPDQKVINRGFGGSYLGDSLYYAHRIVIPYKPRMIVVHAGNNDINGGRSPEQVLADFKAFVEVVRAELPDVRIAYLEINPSPSRWAQRERQRKANALIKAYTESGKNLDFIPLWDALLGPDGQPRPELYLKDRLHNNEEGYKIRAEVVRPHLKE